MSLLERGEALAALDSALSEATASHGRLVLVSGEAGIGKTTLVDRFTASVGPRAAILKGNCDAYFTPTPLGPLYDIARVIGGRLGAELAREAPRAVVFSTFLEFLADRSETTLLVIEDVHWADEATLDFVKFLSRRMKAMRLLIVLTFRDDELGSHNLLRLMIGDLPASPATMRIDMERLSLTAVRTLVGNQPYDAELVHRQTSGNPFFVREILSNIGVGIPRSIRDSILSRMTRLGREGIDVLEAASVFGSRVDPSQLERMLGQVHPGLTECLKLGLLTADSGGIAFRHELVRNVVETDLDPVRRRMLCGQALRALRSGQVGGEALTQIVHFASGAGDAEAVMEFGPKAAAAASAVGAHRAAAAHYLVVLDFAERLEPSAKARIWEAYAEECAIIDELAKAEAARREAIALWRAAGVDGKVGENLAGLAWPLVRSGRNDAAEEVSRQAISVLERLPPSRELASAYRIKAHLRMLDRDRDAAVHWGQKAIALATRCKDFAIVAEAENVVGSAMLVSGDEAGLAHLERSRAYARENGIDSLVALTYLNIGSSYGELYRFAEAERYLLDGIDYATERDLDHANRYMLAWLALVRLHQGRWDESSELATRVVDRPQTAAITRIMALVALGRLRTRRGDPGGAAVLDEALELAMGTHTLQRLAPVHAARAEAAASIGDSATVIAEASAVYGLALEHHHPWHLGELAFWRCRAGDRIEVPRDCAPPYLAHLAGDWRRAAQLWADLGCPYEQARALADGDEKARLEALSIFDRLGAAPAAAALRLKLRESGMRRIPRGPRVSTRRNPFGLTTREVEVLTFVSRGMSNVHIGRHLHVSPKTVDHHVAAILAKLDAANRVDAARIAHEHGLIAQK
jgi:ATP/maltotriose-dependent transcriptional regulator MalT